LRIIGLRVVSLGHKPKKLVEAQQMNCPCKEGLSNAKEKTKPSSQIYKLLPS
jgi:hypothetical protein